MKTCRGLRFLHCWSEGETLLLGLQAVFLNSAHRDLWNQIRWQWSLDFLSISKSNNILNHQVSHSKQWVDILKPQTNKQTNKSNKNMQTGLCIWIKDCWSYCLWHMFVLSFVKFVKNWGFKKGTNVFLVHLPSNDKIHQKYFFCHLR